MKGRLQEADEQSLTLEAEINTLSHELAEEKL